MTTRTRIIILGLTVVFSSLIFVIPQKAKAQLFDGSAQQACQGISGGDSCNSGSAKSSIDGLIATVINIFSWIVGITAVIMMIIGGLKYVTSNGDSNNVNSAKNTILYAVIGLIVVAMAQVIVKFVLKQVD